jgi:HEAT repeat protein
MTSLETMRMARVTPWLLSLALLAFGLAGWLRATRSRCDAVARDGQVAELGERFAEAGYAERIRMIHRFAPAGGATGPLIEVLHAAVTDRERIAAIRRLGQLGSEEAVRELEAQVGQGKHRLQRHVIAALGSAGSESAVAALRALLAPGGVARANRSAVIAALGEAGGDAASAALAALALDRGEEERERAIRALGATGSERALTVLRTLLADEVEAIQTAAVAALGELGTIAARAELERVCRSGSAALREAAARALGGYGGDEVEARLATLVADADPAVAKAALIQLAAMDGPVAERTLHAALRSPSSALREEAAEALLERGEAAGVQAMIGLLGTSQAGWVARRLAGSKDPAARRALHDAASNGKGAAATASIRALAQVPGKAVDELLLGVVNHGAPGVAAEALEAIAQRRGRASLPLLLGALREGGGEVRNAALAAVAELGDPSTRTLLVEAARLPDRSARHAIRGLVKIGGPELPATLLAIAESGRPAAGEALEALAELGGPQARSALLRGLTSADYRVGHAATSALAKLVDPELNRTLQDRLADPSLSSEAKQRILSIWSERDDRASLLQAAQGPDRGVAREALEALGRCGGADAERALTSAASGGQLEQRQAALKGLRELGTPGAVRSLGHALLQPELLEAATAALATVGSRDAMRAVSDRYQSGSVQDRVTILGQLGDEPNPWSRVLLTTALESRDGRIAVAAGEALASYLPVEERRQLIAALRDGGDGASAALARLRARVREL